VGKRRNVKKLLENVIVWGVGLCVVLTNISGLLVLVLMFVPAPTVRAAETNDASVVLSINRSAIGGTNCMRVSSYLPLSYTNAAEVAWWMCTDLNGTWFIVPPTKVVGQVVRKVTNDTLYVEMNYKTVGSVGPKFFRLKLTL
jgi:hypothetical protein